MPASRVTAAGRVISLNSKGEPRDLINGDQITDPEKLARHLSDQMAAVNSLRQRFDPKRIDFEDQVVDATGTTKYLLPHRFNGRVRFWVVDWQTGTAAPNLRRHADTDGNTLVLTSTVAGTATIRVEQAG